MKSLELAENVLAVWQGLHANRPDHFAVLPLGYEQLTFGSLEAVFLGWTESLAALSNASWLSPGEIAVADASLARRLTELPALISGANQYGLGTLYAGNFIDVVADLNARINALTTRTARVGRNVVRSLRDELVENADKVTKASAAADAVMQATAEAEEARGIAISAGQEAMTALEDLREVSRESDSLKGQISEAEAFIAARRQEVEKLYAEASTARDGADLRALQVEHRLVDLSAEVEAARTQVSTARESLDEALNDARKEGLAGAFTSSARRLGWEQVIWGALFVASVAGLIYLAIVFAQDIKDFTYEELLVATLRRLALAAPAIWAGWYAATQLGRVSKIKEDYEFKAATALAFQSYEKSVNAAGSVELKAELLRRTISNFGDNPARLFDDRKREPATPTEALLKSVDADPLLKIAERVKALMN